MTTSAICYYYIVARFNTTLLLLYCPLYQQAVECSPLPAPYQTNVLPYPHLNSLQALDISTSYSCDCYLHKDHTPPPWVTGDVSWTLLLYDNVGHLLQLHGGLTPHKYVTPLLSIISAGGPMFFPTRTFNRLQCLVAILDTPMSYP